MLLIMSQGKYKPIAEKENSLCKVVAQRFVAPNSPYFRKDGEVADGARDGARERALEDCRLLAPGVFASRISRCEYLDGPNLVDENLSQFQELPVLTELDY